MEKMAAYTLVVSAMMLCLLPHCSAQNARMVVNPTNLQLTRETSSDGDEVVATCSSTASDVNIMSIRRVLHSNPNTAPANLASSKGGDTSISAGVSLPGAEVDGSADSRTITLTMPQTKCRDAGMFICEVFTFDTDDGVQTFTASANLTAEVLPGNMTLVPTGVPSGQGTLWYIGDQLTLTCNSHVGSVDDVNNPMPAIDFVWQIQYPPAEFQQNNWQAYLSDTTASSNDIENQTPISDTVTSCNQKRAISVLTRNLTADDNGRQYRCFVRRGSSDNSEVAIVYSVGDVAAPGTTPDTGPNTGSDDDPSSASTGAIVGGVIGGLLVLVIVIVIVIFVLRRKRQKGEEYAAEVDPSKPADEQVPPYNPNPDSTVTYSQPNRFRDKGWDERERTKNSGRERTKNSEGLHYADLDLVRKPPTDDSMESVSSRNQPTEYASIRLY